MNDSDSFERASAAALRLLSHRPRSEAETRTRLRRRFPAHVVERVMESLTRYVETVATIWRLATEVEKTQRRINAIENVFIPESSETVLWIKSVMEENDREELFRRKLLKSRSEQ